MRSELFPAMYRQFANCVPPTFGYGVRYAHCHILKSTGLTVCFRVGIYEIKTLNKLYKTLSIFRPFKNKSTKAGNKRIMGCITQMIVHQLNTSTIPVSHIISTTPTGNIFSIQRPVASHSDAKRNATGRRTRRDWQPNALQRASRCGKKQSGEWRHIA